MFQVQGIGVSSIPIYYLSLFKTNRFVAKKIKKLIKNSVEKERLSSKLERHLFTKIERGFVVGRGNIIKKKEPYLANGCCVSLQNKVLFRPKS